MIKKIAAVTTTIFCLSGLIFGLSLVNIGISEAHVTISKTSQATLSSSATQSSKTSQATQSSNKTAPSATKDPKKTQTKSSPPKPNTAASPESKTLTFKAKRPSKELEIAMIQKMIISKSFVFPVAGKANFSDNFGAPRKGYLHQGVDIPAKLGTPVVAAEAGSAVFMTGQNAGNYVVLKSKTGITYRYMHLSKFGSKGQVKAGAVIGYVGNTGNAAGSKPHLHFEMWQGSLLLNPFLILKASSPIKMAAAPAKTQTK